MSSHLQALSGLLFLSLVGCVASESAEKDTVAFPTGLTVAKKSGRSETILASETHSPLQLSYLLTNVSNEKKYLRLANSGCGCVAATVTSEELSEPLAVGSVFTIAANKSVTLTLDVRMSGKPMGSHTFPIRVAVVSKEGDEELLLPEYCIRLLPDISAAPPILSHQFRRDNGSVVEKQITLTALQRKGSDKRLLNPILGPLPDYITLQELRQLESMEESGEYRTEKWIIGFTLKSPLTEAYTVANSFRITFPDSPLHDITIPSVITAKWGVDVLPRSLIFGADSTVLSEKRSVLLTATDSRPFTITRITCRENHFRAKVNEKKNGNFTFDRSHGRFQPQFLGRWHIGSPDRSS